MRSIKDLDPKIMEGKTIVKVNAQAHNAWHIEFNDGTKLSLWSDDNPLQTKFGTIPGLSLGNYDASEPS